MTFKNNFIVEVKSNGKIMRVRDGAITLPFGTEYSIYMKNLDSRKAVATLSVDGKDALDGNCRIIMPNSSTLVNGFMKGMKSSNKFKFTRKTKRISEHRGNLPNDGIIRVEYWFEQSQTIPRESIQEIMKDWPPTPGYRRSYPFFETGDSSVYSSKTTGDFFDNHNVLYSMSCCNFSPKTEEGITVNGTKLDESFVYGNVNLLEKTSSVICIKLNGYNKKKTKKIKQPIYTKTKLVCEVCGTRSRSFAKYCRHCGNNIE